MRYYWYIEAIGGKLVWECPEADSVAKQLGNLLEGLCKFPLLQAKCFRKSNTYVQVRDLKSCSNLTMARLASKLNSLQLHHVPAVFTLHYTSSTAQGGGGSFKDRKLYIGEVICCDAWMAERIHWWTERWLELCFLERLQRLQRSPHPQLLDAVGCSAVVVVV